MALLGLVVTLLLTSLTPVASATQPAPPVVDASTGLAATLEDEPDASLIYGIVRDSSGAPLDDIQVEALSAADPDGDPVASALTYETAGSEHGGYELSLPAGDYLVRFRSPDFAFRDLYETKYYTAGTSQIVSVGETEAVELDDVTLVKDTGVPVSGTVRDADAEPVAGVQVSLLRYYPGWDSWEEVDWATTDAQGSYEFAKVNRNRRHTVQVEGEWSARGDERLGYADAYLGNAVAAGLADEFSLASDSAGLVLDEIVLQKGVRVVGRANAPGNDSWGNATLFVRADTGEWHRVSSTGFAFGERYKFRAVAPGHDYTVAATDDEEGLYETVYLGDVTEPAAATVFTPVAGSDTLLEDINLVARPPRLTGSVTDLGGRSLPDTSVILYERQEVDGRVEWNEIDWAETDAAGGYAFRRDVLPGGTYTVYADGGSSGHGAAFLGGASTLEDAATVTGPALGETADAGVIALAREMTTLRGALSLPAGEVFSGQAQIDLLKWDEVEQQFFYADTTWIDSDSYVFRDIGAGHYTAVATYWDRRYDAGDVYDQAWLGGAMPTQPTDAGVVEVTEEAASGSVDLTADDIVLRRQRLLSGTVTAADGGLLDGEVSLGLYKWDPVYESFEHYDSTWTDDSSYYFPGLDAGTYSVRAEYYPYDGEAGYLPSWYGGAAPVTEGDPGVLVVGEEGDVSGVDIELVRGIQVSGLVTNGQGQPLPDAYVELRRWVEQAPGEWQTELAGHAYSSSRGRYSAVVEPDDAYTVSAHREGFESYFLGGESWPSAPTDANSLVIGTTDTQHDITMTPDWTGVGAIAVQKRDHCLTTSFWQRTKVDFGPADGLYVSSPGVVSDQSLRTRFRPELLEESGRVALLAPFMDRPVDWGGQATWGVSPDGGELCVLWRDRYDDSGETNTYQLLMSADPAGGYDVTYNYDRVGWARDARVGWTDGRGAAGDRMVLTGAGSVGYLDTDLTTGLVHNSAGDPQPGRYVFHYDGFDDPQPRPRNLERPSVDGVHAEGETLTAQPGTWEVDGAPAGDLEFVYTWVLGRNGVQTVVGSGSTYVPTTTDRGGRLRVRVQASLGEPQAGFAESEPLQVAEGPRAATSTEPPVVSPPSPVVGDVLSTTTGQWAVDGGVQEDLTFSYRWVRDGVRIPWESEATYVVREDDANSEIVAVVVASRPGYADVPARSAAVTVADAPTLAHTIAPSISGNPAVGEPLTVDPGVWETSGAGTPDFEYTWKVNSRTVYPTGSPDQYTPTLLDAGGYVTVIVRAHLAGFTSGVAKAVVGPVSDDGVGLGSLQGIAVRDADGSPVPGASWQACEANSWTCVWGSTGTDGSFTSSSVPATDAGTPYRVTVHAPAGTDLTNAQDEVVITAGGTVEVALRLRAVAPPPPNVDVTTSSGVYQGAPVVYWGEPQTFTVVGCAVEDPAYAVTFSDGTPPQSGSMQAAADQSGLATGLVRYTATIPPFYPAHDLTTITTNVPADCGPGTPPTEFTIYIDPSGVVTDQYGRPISGATVTLLAADSPAGPFAPVPAGSDVMSPDNRQNPDTTDGVGFFRWDVAEGWYKVKVEKAGCATYTTPVLPVPPPAIDLLLKTTCETAPPTVSQQPTVTGTPTPGSTLTASLGTWSAPLEGSVEWLRDGVPIPGETSTSYDVTAADVGSQIRVRHTGKRPSYVQEEGRGAVVGFDGVISVSDGMTVAAGEAASATVLPSVSGDPRVGAMLTASSGSWDADGLLFRYQWLNEGSPIEGATGSSYVVTPADVLDELSVRVTASRAGYQDGVADSPAVTIPKLPSRAAATLPKPKVKAGKVAYLVVKVTATGVTPTGKVKILKGKSLFKTVTLKTSHRGKLTVKLGGFKRGKYTWRVKYLGNSVLGASTSKAVTLTVAR